MHTEPSQLTATNGEHSGPLHADGGTDLLEQARRNVAAAGAHIDQCAKAAAKARREREAAEARRKESTQAERDENARHREALATITADKRKAAAERDRAKERADAADAELAAARSWLARNNSVVRTLEASRAPRNRATS